MARVPSFSIPSMLDAALITSAHSSTRHVNVVMVVVLTVIQFERLQFKRTWCFTKSWIFWGTHYFSCFSVCRHHFISLRTNARPHAGIILIFPVCVCVCVCVCVSCTHSSLSASSGFYSNSYLGLCLWAAAWLRRRMVLLYWKVTSFGRMIKI